MKTLNPFDRLDRTFSFFGKICAIAIGSVALTAAARLQIADRRVCNNSLTLTATQVQINSSQTLADIGCHSYKRLRMKVDVDTNTATAVFISTWNTNDETLPSVFTFYGRDGEVVRDWVTNLPVYAFVATGDPNTTFQTQFEE